MKNLFLFIFSLLCLPALASYSGRVYIDKNGNGVYDKTDTPLLNVAVTDGRNVVKTSKDGRFTLPGYEKTRFISITTPSGYSIEKFYIPVDKAIKSYNFILTRNNKDEKRTNHSFIQIADTEIHNNGVGSWAWILKEYIASEKPDFLIHTGDICYEGGLKAHIQVVNSQTMGCPVYYGIGNHDLVKGDYGEQLYESLYGPTWYSFDIQNTHYVMTPMRGGDYKPSYTVEEVYQWLKNDLAVMQPDMQLVIFNHDILTSGNDFFFGPNKTEYIDLRKHNLKAWIYGHWHFNYVRNQNGVYTISTSTLDKGGISHSASAFRVIDVNNNSLSTQLHYCFVEPQAVIASPQNGQTVAESVPIIVNAYHSGSEVKNVTYQYAEKGSNSLSNSQNLKQLSNWTWGETLFIPNNLIKKDIEIYVTATFSNGKTITSTNSFTSMPPETVEVKTGDNWNTLSGNAQHTGSNNARLGERLELNWVRNVGKPIFMASPVYANGKVYVAAINDDIVKQNSPISGGIYCFDAESGMPEWEYKTRNSVINTIAHESGIIFAQDAEGWLYATDAETGKLRWEKKLNISFPYLCEGLTAENGVIYAGTGKGLGAFRANDGTEIWINKDWQKNEGATTTLALGDGVLVSGSQWGALYGNDAATGKMLWKLSKDGMSNRGGSATLYNGKFYIISGSRLFIIEPKSGEIIQEKELKGFSLDVTSTPLITDTEIIFGTADKGLIALDKESLTVKWNTPTEQSLVYTAPYTTVPYATVETSPVLVENTIFFGASDGYLYGLKAGTGEIVWKHQSGTPVFASVAVSGNTLFAVDFGGNVYAFVNKEKLQ